MKLLYYIHRIKMDTKEIQDEIKRINLIRFNKGWGTVVISLIQGNYGVRAFGTKMDEYKDTGLYRTPERAIEEIMRLEISEY